ncbi:MAG TPA: squalene/phytoene synthase family protein [Solirubrobacteraceae bacterium]|nr:squalene/phytoene synthase family protein [Solirubrobacteraceae bacterium]
MFLLRSPDPTLAEARSTTRQVARTFALACRLLPREVRDDVYRLYLVFRTLDDLVDEGRADALERVAALERWCDDGVARSRETQVLGQLARRHTVPRHAVRDFCAGMRDDLAGATMTSEDELDGYCYRVAGTVGVVMAELLGVRERDAALPAAAALGMAMQRTNILRDIDEDRANGRVYLARETIERCEGTLEAGQREALLRDGIARADALYERGVAGIGLLLCGRRAVAAAAAMYREILREIEREGYGTRPGRAVVPRRRKLLVAARAPGARAGS